MKYFKLTQRNTIIHLNEKMILKKILLDPNLHEDSPTKIYFLKDNLKIPICTLILNKIESVDLNIILEKGEINFEKSNQNNISLIGLPYLEKNNFKEKLVVYEIKNSMKIDLKRDVEFFLATTDSINRISLIVEIENLDVTLCNLSSEIPYSKIPLYGKNGERLKLKIIGNGTIFIFGNEIKMNE